MNRRSMYIGSFLILALVVPGPRAAAEEADTRVGPSGVGVICVAHRGGIVPGYPENTLTAFRRAIEVGVDAIEIDLRGTRDGSVVILHDPTLDRTTDGTGPVTSSTLAALKGLDAGGGQRIPTYREVLEMAAQSRVTLLLDIKVSPELDKARVVRLTEEFGAVLNVIVGVRALDDLREFRNLNPNLRTLGFIPGPDHIEEFADAGVDIIRLWPRWIRDDPDLVAQVHDLGRPVWITAGEAENDELQELLEYGVDGILTDHPERLVNLLNGRGGRPE